MFENSNLKCDSIFEWIRTERVAPRCSEISGVFRLRLVFRAAGGLIAVGRRSDLIILIEMRVRDVQHREMSVL